MTESNVVDAIDWEAQFAAHCLIALSKSRSSPSSLTKKSQLQLQQSNDHGSNKIYLKIDNSTNTKIPVPLQNVTLIRHVPPSPSDRLFRPNVPLNFNYSSSIYGSNASSPVDSREDGGQSSPSISSLDSLPLTLTLSKKCDLGVRTAGPFFTTTPSSPSSSTSSSSCFSPVMLDQPVDLTRSSNGECVFH